VLLIQQSNYAGIKPHNLFLKIKWLSTNAIQYKIALKELLWSRIMSAVLGMGSAGSPSTLCHDTDANKTFTQVTLAPNLTGYCHQGYGQLDRHF